MASLSQELAELRRIARHLRPVRRALRFAAEFAAVAVFVGGALALSLGSAERPAVHAPTMIAEAR